MMDDNIWVDIILDVQITITMDDGLMYLDQIVVDEILIENLDDL